MDVLRGMGFAQSVCSAALAASDGDVDSALSLLLEHGPEFFHDSEQQSETAGETSSVPTCSEESFSATLAMGFTPLAASKALVVCRGDVEAASRWLVEQSDDASDLDWLCSSDELLVALRGGCSSIMGMPAKSKLHGGRTPKHGWTLS